MLGLATSNVSVDEDAGQVSIDVLRTQGSDGEATVDYATQPDTATAGDDYTPQSGTLTFADGETVKTIVIPIVNDTDSEPTEQFKITIDNAIGATLLVPRTATVTIFDDETVLPNYADFASVAGLNLNGDAQQLGNILQLTADASQQAGSAFYDQAISLANDGSFRSVFSFQMLGGTTGADGLTFTIQNDPNGSSAIGGPGSDLGFEGITNAVAAEFDNFDLFPGEIGRNHVAFISGSVTNELTQAAPIFDLNDGSTYHAWVDYNGVSDSLSVYLSDTPTKPQYLLLETEIDLEAVVGTQVYVGFTAGTGGSSNAHQILSWQLDQIPPPLDPPTEPGGTITPVDLITNINEPTAVDWLPDGTMLIAQKSGVVRVANGSTLDPTPFIDISDIVNNVRDRGLLDIAVHPDFLNNKPFVYLLFTYEGIEPENNNEAPGTLAGPDGRGNRAGRLIRVTADVQNNYRTAVAGSEVVLLGTNSIRDYFNAFANSTFDFDEPPGGELPNGDYVQDFIQSDSESHSVGGLAFSPDGLALYVSTGDGASYNQVDVRADRVQDVDSLSGKILRIDPITGEGLTDNPFYNLTNDPDANSAKVYQLGLRNPFRISVDDATGQLYVGDVGWATWEEINAAGPGANFGWPFYEGGNGQSLVNSLCEHT